LNFLIPEGLDAISTILILFGMASFLV